jgi:hypothetical protein
MVSEGSETTTFVCAWCDRVYRRGAWRVAQLDAEPTRVTHGICEECAGEMVPAASTQARDDAQSSRRARLGATRGGSSGCLG